MSTNPRVDERDPKLQSWDQAEPLFKDWLVRTAAAQYGHQLKADRSRVYSLLFGIPLVVLSTFVGTSVFASVNHSPSNGLKWLVGGVSVAAAALGSVQTFLGYAQLSERHRVAAIRYANLRREVQQAIAAQDFGPATDIRREMDKIGQAGPQIGDKTWRRSLDWVRTRELSGVPMYPEADSTLTR